MRGFGLAGVVVLLSAVGVAGRQAAVAQQPSLFTVLQDKLGLRLEAQMVPVEMLVVDGVERVPVEN